MRFSAVALILLGFVITLPAVAQTNTDTTAAAAVPAPPKPTIDARPVAVTITTRDFRVCPNPSRWRTSSHYLRETARCIQKQNPDDAVEAKRTALIEDIFIKSWSYAILNKAFFWLSVALAVLVLTWPSLVAIFRKPEQPAQNGGGQGTVPVTLTDSGAIQRKDPKPKDEPKESFIIRAVNAASMQTTITALAALSFAFYAHYKERQSVSENLMRTVLYAPDLSDPVVADFIKDMAAMDKGFGFSAALGQPSSPDPEPPSPL